MIVLSQFLTFTVVSAISTTSPSAPYLGISSQSPTASMLLADNCIPATKPKIGSLNTNNSTADKAPKPLSKINGDLSISSDTARIPVNTLAISLMVCKSPLRGNGTRLERLSDIAWKISSSVNNDNNENIMIH